MRLQVHRNKVLLIILVTISIGIMLTFQNCSQSTDMGPKTSKASPVATKVTAQAKASGTSIQQAPAREALPIEASLAHLPNERNFAISLKNLAVQGSNCILQFYKNNSAWTNLGTLFPCNKDISSLSYSLPTEPHWTNNFVQGVELRIVKVIDQSEVVAFSQKLTCLPSPASSTTATPDIDENCNQIWDDSIASEFKRCEYENNVTTVGASSTCNPTYACDGKEYNFKNQKWIQAVTFFTSADCQSGEVTSNNDAVLYGGIVATVPEVVFQKGCSGPYEAFHATSTGKWGRNLCNYGDYWTDTVYH